VGPRAGLNGCGKCGPHQDFLFVCASSFFRSVLFIHCAPLCPLSVCHLFLYNTHTHKHPCHRQDFFLFSPCTLSVLLCPDCPGLCLLSILYNTHNTNIHAPGGIRTHNPSKRSAANPRLRPLCHWDRQIRSPDRPARNKSLYQLDYRGPYLPGRFSFILKYVCLLYSVYVYWFTCPALQRTVPSCVQLSCLLTWRYRISFLARKHVSWRTTSVIFLSSSRQTTRWTRPQLPTISFQFIIH
jgi:hypothetical protein